MKTEALKMLTKKGVMYFRLHLHFEVFRVDSR